MPIIANIGCHTRETKAFGSRGLESIPEILKETSTQMYTLF